MAEATTLAQLTAQVLGPPLQLVSVESRGVPYQERIYLRANQRVNLRDYLLLVGLRLSDDTAFPANDTMFWLGNHTVDAGTWVVVYTCNGTPLVTRLRESGEPALVLYWGRSTTLFAPPQLVPTLVQIGQVQVAPPLGSSGANRA